MHIGNRTGAALVAIAAIALAINPLMPTGAAASQARVCERGTFKNFHNDGNGAPPPTYKGKVFRLSQDYPASLPPEGDYPWLKIPVKDGRLDAAGSEAYVNALRDYAYQGNVDHDWVTQDNPVRRWFDAPWMDVTAAGREFVHGLTHEIDALASHHTLGPQQKNDAQTWAVAAFNDRGGWAIGQMWCDPRNPDPDKLNPRDDHPNAMPNGTMIYKLLFTTASDEDAPFLRDTFEWDADAYTTTGDRSADPPRTIKRVRLIQMDVAARDDRFPNGWAFGTLSYNRADPGAGPLDRMVPLGLMWGNDPGLTANMITQEGAALRESWINTAPVAKDLPDNHLGWGGRLAGPLDNPKSSCMSCHQTAGFPVEPIIPEIAKAKEFPSWAGDNKPIPDEVKLNWFLDVPAGVSWSARQRFSLDYSLQLSMGLARFYEANCKPQALEEVYSPRGTEQPAARDLAIGACPKLAHMLQPKHPRRGLHPLLVVALMVLALGVGVLGGRSRRPGATTE